MSEDWLAERDKVSDEDHETAHQHINETIRKLKAIEDGAGLAIRVLEGESLVGDAMRNSRCRYGPCPDCGQMSIFSNHGEKIVHCRNCEARQQEGEKK